jgi:hypothetical protein
MPDQEIISKERELREKLEIKQNLKYYKENSENMDGYL